MRAGKGNHEFTDLAEAVETKPRWLLQDVLPVGLHILGGPPKFAMKSTLTYVFALACAGIKCAAVPSWMARATRTGRVLMFSQEATAGEVKYAARVGLGAKILSGHVFVADDPFAWRLDVENAKQKMYAALDEHKPALTVLDPLRDFHSLDEKDSGEIISVLGPLRAWAVMNDSCVLVVHHTVKPQEGKSIVDPASLRGSGAIFGKADGVIMAAPSQKQMGYLEYSAVFKRGAPWTAQVKLGAWGEETREWFPPRAKAFLKLLKGGSTVMQARAQLSVTGEEEWRAMRDPLIRNGQLAYVAGNHVITKQGMEWCAE